MRCGRRHRPLRAAAVVFALCALAGCATFSERIAQLERHLVAGDYPAATAALERINFEERDAALRLLNRGMLLRLSGDYQASNADFEAAKQLMDELAKLSLREEALGVAVNEQIRAYAGQPFERLFLLVYKALNYLALGDRDGARVETLQIDLLLRELSSSEPESKILGAAFARYISGVIYELHGERSDAFIAYEKAARNYAGQVEDALIPVVLRQDLLRLGNALGRSDDARRYAGDSEQARAERTNTEEAGELIVLVSSGRAPPLREQAVTLPEPISGRLMRIALPASVPRSQPVQSVRLRADGKEEVGSLVADITQLSRLDLESRLPGMTARLVARQVVKSQAVRHAGKAAMSGNRDSGERAAAAVLAIGVELAALFTERADTRSWISLPGTLMLVRLPLPAGEYAPRLIFRGRYNETVAERQLPPVRLGTGERVFLTDHFPGQGSVVLPKAR